MGPEYRTTATRNPSRAALVRDAALDRLGRTRRWVILATAALTAGFAALVSAVAPGRTLSSKSAVRTEASTAAPSTRGGHSSGIPAMPAPASAGQLGLQGSGDGSAPAPPQSQPQSAPPQPQAPPAPPVAAPPSSSGGVVSGGS